MDDPFLQAFAGDIASLPPAVRMLHRFQGRLSGRCRIERGRGALIALAMRLGQFPPEGCDVAVTLDIWQSDNRWFWERNFGGHITRSELTYDASTGLVRERMGALSFGLRPRALINGLAIDVIGLSVFGIACPRWALPLSETKECHDELGRFRFDVGARLPGLGLLIRYRGWLSNAVLAS